MKKITINTILFSVFILSTFFAKAQGIIWDTYQIEVVVPIDQLDSFSIGASSSCAGEVTISWEDETFSGGCYGHVYRTYLATDACGDSSTAFQIIEVSNTSLLFEENVFVDCSEEIPAPQYALVYDDASLVVDITDVEDGQDCDRTITRTFHVTDACGHQADHIQMINFEDTIPPQIHNVIENFTVSCNAIPDPESVFATDNCDNNVVLSLTQSVGGTPCQPIVYRNWVATDICGNTTIMTQSITLISNPHFVFGFNEEIFVECSDIPEPPVVIISGACDDDIPIIYTSTVEDEGCGQLITRTWIADDNCGHHMETSQLIHLVDTTVPVLSVPVDEQITCADDVPDLVAAEVYVYDNCNDDIDLLVDETITNQGNCPYVITRTWTAIDPCGNTTVASQHITVVEGPEPSLNELIEITSIAPNPAVNRSEIQFVSSVDTHAVLEVYDMNGRKIEGLFNQDIEANLFQKVDVFVDNLDEGIYFLRLTSNEGQSTKKIVVSK